MRRRLAPLPKSQGADIIMNDESPNKPDAPNPAIAPQFHVRRHWRGVGDPGRSQTQ